MVSGSVILCGIDFQSAAAGVIVHRLGAAGATSQNWVDADGTAITVALLPSASTAGAGARHFVTDANANTFNTVAASGGTNKVPVFSDGTNWRIG